MQDWLDQRQAAQEDWKAQEAAREREEAQKQQRIREAEAAAAPPQAISDTPRSLHFSKFKARTKLRGTGDIEALDVEEDQEPETKIKVDRFAGDITTGATMDIEHLIQPCQELVATIKRGALRFQLGDATFGFNGPEFKDNQERCDWAWEHAERLAAASPSEISFCSWAAFEEQRITKHEQHCNDISNHLAELESKIRAAAEEVSRIHSTAELHESAEDLEIRAARGLEKWQGLVKMYQALVAEAQETQPWRTRDEYRLNVACDPPRGVPRTEALWFDVLDVHTTESPDSVQERVNAQIAQEQAGLAPGVNLDSSAWALREKVLLEAAGQQFFCTMCWDGAAFYDSERREIRGETLAWRGESYKFMGHKLVWEWQRKSPGGQVVEAFKLLKRHLEAARNLPQQVKELVPGRAEFLIQMAVYGVYERDGVGGKILIRRPVEAVLMSNAADRIEAFKEEQAVATQVAAKYFQRTPEEQSLQQQDAAAQLRRMILHPWEHSATQWIALAPQSEDAIASRSPDTYGAAPPERHAYGAAEWVQAGAKSFR